jgi:hypothetical protein
MPTTNEVLKEAAIVIMGALLAAFVVRNLPEVKAYIKDSWS